MNQSVRIFVSLLFAGMGSLCAQTGFNLGLGGPANLETIQDQFVFSNSGVTAIATAWGRNQANMGNGFEKTEVVQWSPGIGAKSPGEVITDTPYVPYYVDNEDYYDFVLFVFNKEVDITSVMVHPSAGTFDLDVSYWLGNVSPSLDLTGKFFSSLTAAGFGSRIDNDNAVASHSPRTFSIDTPAGGVNALLIGARVYGDSEVDRFKISSIGGSTVPEPSTAALLLGASALVLRRRR